MLINSKDISTYNCKCIKFKPSIANYSLNGTFISNGIYNGSVGKIQGENRTIDSEFIFFGNKDAMQRNMTRFIEEIKESIIYSCSFFYKVIFEGEVSFDVVTNNSVKLSLKLNLLNVYEEEKVVNTTVDTTINIKSPKPCMADLEILATTTVIDYTLTINDIEIVIKNIKANETIYIENGKVVAGGKSKIEDVEIWEFPYLKTGNNAITVSREDVNLKIKYKERW